MTPDSNSSQQNKMLDLSDGPTKVGGFHENDRGSLRKPLDEIEEEAGGHRVTQDSILEGAPQPENPPQ